MALHLNLYHEIQTQKLHRKRDPLRLGMLAIHEKKGTMVAVGDAVAVLETGEHEIRDA